jgi:hypothetical protein
VQHTFRLGEKGRPQPEGQDAYHGEQIRAQHTAKEAEITADENKIMRNNT